MNTLELIKELHDTLDQVELLEHMHKWATQGIEPDWLDLVEEAQGYAGNIESEQELSERFDEMLEDCMPGFDTRDTVAVRTAFNDWSDALTDDGELHALQYSQYCYVGKYR